MNLTKNLKKIKGLIFFGILINLLHTVYVNLRFEFLNPQIPFWYTMPWGNRQLASNADIYLLPITSWIILGLGILILLFSEKFHLRYGREIISNTILASILLLAYSSVKIIFKASTPFEPLIEPEIFMMLLTFAISFTFAYLISPKIISFMFNKGVVTDPGIHKHPAMILVKPSARGGGVIFAIVFILVGLFMVPLSQPVLGLFFGVFLSALLGYMDDIQNTQIHSKLKFLENPIIRLILQSLIALFVVLIGFRIDFINNPFNGIIFFNTFSFNLFGQQIFPIAIVITTLWFVWIMNMLSWSNSIDGQYSGIIGISAIALVFLTLRPGLEDTILPKEVIASLALLLAGASFGILPFNWHPSKIMWGFGAIAAGLVFASLAIATKAKISASIIVVLIPFIDGLITIVRRIIQGKFPLKADKQHLSHILLQRGWSVKKIAIFYWISTAILGLVSVFAADKDLPLLILSIWGAVGLIIGFFNIQALKDRAKQQLSE